MAIMAITATMEIMAVIRRRGMGARNELDGSEEMGVGKASGRNLGSGV